MSCKCKHRCEKCGANLTNDCELCENSQCCPQCCKIDHLEFMLQDWQDSYNIVIQEKCSNDEVHCTCVPALRMEIKRLQNKISKIKETLYTLSQAEDHLP